MNFARIGLIVVAASLAGCAATVVKNTNAAGAVAVRVPAASSGNLVLNITGNQTVVSSGDWAGFRKSWRDAVSAEASADALPFSMQDGPPAPTGQAGTLVCIYVNDYRWISAGARAGLGILTGNAYVDAKVSFMDLQTGQSFGEETINTSSSAWQGAFSAMTDKQLQAIAKDLVGDVRKH